jgi:hypothetical protein
MIQIAESIRVYVNGIVNLLKQIIMEKVKKSVKKAKLGDQVKPTPDSTGYYSKKVVKAYGEKDFAGAKKASDDVARQSKKGKPGYDANGFPVKKKMKSGGSLKPVAADQKGLAKLPTPVRNKMGYQKDGGKMKKAKSGVSLSPSKQSVSDELGGYKRVIGKNYSGKAKAGKSVKKAMGGMKMMMSGGKCKYGC